MDTAVASVELRCIFCAIRVDVISLALTARIPSRPWGHIILNALLKGLATARDSGCQADRHLHVTEGLHFQTILSIRCYHGDYRQRAAAEGAAGFGETPVVVPAISTVHALQWVCLRDCCVHSTTIHEMVRMFEIHMCPGQRVCMSRVKASVYAPIHDPADSTGDFVVGVRAAIAETPVADEVSMDISIDSVCARQSSVLHHMPINV